MTVRVIAVGNLTADPELRFTSSGQAVCTFTVASTERYRKGNEWQDGDSCFLRCTVWREQAEQVAAAVTKGTRVTVTGSLVTRSYDDKEGNTRYVTELKADEVSASMKHAHVKINKIERNRQEPGSNVTPLPSTGTDGAPF